jgi:kinesin family protein 5
MCLGNNLTGNINVVCRFRPLNDKEKQNTQNICVEFLDEQQINIKSSSENNNYRFSFDHIFQMSSDQSDIFKIAASPIIESVLEGFNGTIFAYGQTSSGKTYTMQGDLDIPEEEGITPRMIRHVFNYFAISSNDTEFTVKVSMLEIYMEKINDLIEEKRVNLNIREDKVKGIYVEDLSEHYVSSEEEVYDLIKRGSSNRAVGKTNMNEHSSRSHLIFIMTIHQTNVKTLISKTGKLYLVDLAGSEKISKTGATGMTLEEAKTINKSLTTLGMVINNLTDGKSSYVPYRDSKLSRILQESIGGNSKTRLIITCSPSNFNEQETLSTLRFGVRAKKIKNKPIINKEVTVAELKLEIDKLEKILLACNSRVNQLEDFISFNGFVLPNQDDFSFRKNVTPSNNILAETNDELSENFSDLNKEDRIENDKRLKEISDKYTNVINQVSILQDDKNTLNEKYELAVRKIKEFSVAVEEKEKLVDELEIMKSRHIELYEKIYELQEKLKDKYQSGETEDIESNDEVPDDILNKIKDILFGSSSLQVSSGSLKENISDLVDMIRLRLNIENEKCIEYEIFNENSFSILNEKHENNESAYTSNSPIEEEYKKEKKRFNEQKKTILKSLEEKSDKVK